MPADGLVEQSYSISETSALASTYTFKQAQRSCKPIYNWSLHQDFTFLFGLGLVGTKDGWEKNNHENQQGG